MSFARYDVDRRTAKCTFFKELDVIIDWDPIEKELKKIYKSGKKERGQKAYNPLILFKMQLVGVWYNLSDVQIEEMTNDSLSVMKFCGLNLEDPVPDHSTLSRFRKELSDKKAYNRLLRKINQQLAKHRLIVKGGAKVDASLTESPFSPKGKPTYELAEDRKEDHRPQEEKEKEEQEQKLNKIEQPGSDTEARWLKKGGKSTYGYKKHLAVDKNGMVLGVHTTTANEHDSKGLEPLIKKVPKTQRKDVMADKGYKSKDNDKMLKKNGSKSRIMHKAYRNTPLTEWEKKYNKAISKTRWVVERTFGGMKRWFGSGVTRLKGKVKNHGLGVWHRVSRRKACAVHP